MRADPETFLAKLEPGREIAAGEVRGLGGALDALVAAGLVTVRKDGRTRRVTLTDAGARRRAALPPPAPKRRAPRSDPLAAVLHRLDALEARIAALEAAGRDAERPPRDPATVKDAVLGAVAELDAAGRMGGLVPIPQLRAALRDRGVGDDAVVTAALVELEREWRIDLNVAQAPTAVADRAAGIERPGRGLLYYVSRRQA
jgi:DNA-binding MarR family transcriptional regulator